MAGAIEGDLFIGKKAQELRGLLKVGVITYHFDVYLLRAERFAILLTDQIPYGAWNSNRLGRYGAHMELRLH